MTLDEIAALEALLAETAMVAPAPWEGLPVFREVLDANGECLTECITDTAPDVARLIAAARNALPALLALARRALEAPNPYLVLDVAGDECRGLAIEPPPSADEVERLLWGIACHTCAERVECLDPRAMARPVPPAAGGAA